MGARDSVLTGSAGEAFVLFRLQLLGLLAAFSPPNAYAADILVFSPTMQVGSMIQVKTRTSGADGGWHMREKHESLVHPRLFYAFLNLEPAEPVVHIIPSAVVARVLGAAYQAWLAAPGKAGSPHHDNPMRRIMPRFREQVSGFADGWMDAYLERWDYISTDPDDRPPTPAAAVP
jgi:hypothetical protein